MKILVHSMPEALGCEETSSWVSFTQEMMSLNRKRVLVDWGWDSVNEWNYITDHHFKNSKGGWVSSALTK